MQIVLGSSPTGNQIFFFSYKSHGRDLVDIINKVCTTFIIGPNNKIEVFILGISAFLHVLLKSHKNTGF